ncbi:MAG TPA: hypothetical protein VLS90_16275 [Thermodesulfobacteriota bacterium]|nr:hypothetical protein [Thermodesulfobacteriota bacterium]
MKRLEWRHSGKTVVAAVALVLAAWVFLFSPAREAPPAFGGNFAPMGQQPAGPRYQIASRDANSAWVIDTSVGDIFLVFADGKWKDVGTILDEKKRIKK